MALIVIGIVALFVAAAVVLLGTAKRRAGTGRLSRETRQADSAGARLDDAPASDATTTDDDSDARSRADDSRRAIEGGGGVPVPAGDRGVVRYEPIDEEELGVTRRQFFNRGILTGMGLAVGGFGGAALAFVWPSSAGGAGAKVNVGSIAQIEADLEAKRPFYNASAKLYIQPYPKADVKKAAKVYPPPVAAGMAQGFVALSQKCPHLGCRVPWCQTSQWFECPCHGSKYNRVGEKTGGPAPRGMDHFGLSVSGGAVIVDTSTLIQGPAIGTDTTGQGQEGAPCV
ncbi:MAG TPA: ubiquinol-cytochrome c reductase iron-sulfur subunit [Acidimicrobiia bacterium]|nr:ubiquinol-cytochrome c reductase iron-sulfur subunit [Acidimicrobiia bacterium]